MWPAGQVALNSTVQCTHDCNAAVQLLTITVVCFVVLVFSVGCKSPAEQVFMVRSAVQIVKDMLQCSK